MSWFHLVPGKVAGLVSPMLWHYAPSWFPPPFLFQLGFRDLFPYFSFLSQEEDCVPSWFSGSFWLRARVPGLVSLLFFRFFLKNGAPNGFFYCAWTWRKYGLLLFGVYAGVFFTLKKMLRFFSHNHVFTINTFFTFSMSWGILLFRLSECGSFGFGHRRGHRFAGWNGTVLRRWKSPPQRQLPAGTSGSASWWRWWRRRQAHEVGTFGIVRFGLYFCLRAKNNHFLFRTWS